jgi:hypothetical protein
MTEIKIIKYLQAMLVRRELEKVCPNGNGIFGYYPVTCNLVTFAMAVGIWGGG